MPVTIECSWALLGYWQMTWHIVWALSTTDINSSSADLGAGFRLSLYINIYQCDLSGGIYMQNLAIYEENITGGDLVS